MISSRCCRHWRGPSNLECAGLTALCPFGGVSTRREPGPRARIARGVVATASGDLYNALDPLAIARGTDTKRRQAAALQNEHSKQLVRNFFSRRYARPLA